MSDDRDAASENQTTPTGQQAIVGGPLSTHRTVGTKLGEFVLLRRLGKGGMAEVWLAEQTSLKRNVALKLLRSDLMEDENAVKRFQTEAKAAAGLNHSNIVQVYTVGCENGQHYIAQEYVHGQTLKALLQKRGPLELSVALMIMRQVAAALFAAGERGIVHRDIKPENIMITRKGEVKVADFGLAQLQGGERLNLTQEGITMGTPLYMSPEQVSGGKLDHRSDIYSFGITCYHMLCGVPPFRGENAVSVAVKHLHEVPNPVGDMRPDLPPAVCQMIERMIAKRPEDRYRDAGVIANDVRKLAKAMRTGESVEELSSDQTAAMPAIRRPGLVAGSLCALIFLMAAGIGWASRVRLPPVNKNALADVPALTNAKDQYLYAMFQIDNEDAFRAVISRFDGRDNKTWTRQAHEQLALLLLKDRRREADARAQLEELKTKVDPGNRYLVAEARVGEAYLDAINNNIPRARTTMQANSEEFNQLLTGSWKQLAQETRQLIDAQRNNRN